MEIHLEGIGKKFRKEWIFRNVNLDFLPSKRYGIVGYNGSGKSTLLQIIAGISLPSEGKIHFLSQNAVLPTENILERLSFSAPYQELIEELTAKEMFDFHFKFRKLSFPISSSDFFEEIGLKGNENKQVKYFSSGMKQRMRLALCVYTEAEVYMLDEPTTNLDRVGVQWYKDILTKKLLDKTLIISSNIEEEYAVCENIFNIDDYKPNF